MFGFYGENIEKKKKKIEKIESSSNLKDSGFV